MERNYKEKNFQTDFGNWLRRHEFQTGAFELKVSAGNGIPFNAVREHQIANLLGANSHRIFYKIPDDSIGQKPFDCFVLAGVQGWVVIMYDCKERGQNVFYMIKAEAYQKEWETSKRKSLTETKAKEIGFGHSLST